MMKAKKKYGFDPDYAVPPGETLKELMESMEMPQKEMAIRLGMTPQSLNRILKGEQPISYETSNRLEAVTKVPARMWNNLESKYQEQRLKIAERQRLADNLAWLKKIPVKELIERECIQDHEDELSIFKEVLSFFGVSSVSAWDGIWSEPKVAARRSVCFESAPGHAAAWIRMGEITAQDIVCQPYSKSAFEDVVKRIRALTVEPPEVFLPEIKKLCAGAGVAVVLVPRISKVPWNGATKWLSPKKAMILLSIRGKGEDKFWFSFFHEASHVLHDNKKNLYINDGSEDDPSEKRADQYASNMLIPSRHNEKIVLLNSKVKILNFAKKLGVSPGIVAGRYQHLTGKWTFYKGLIRTLKWV